MRQSLNGRDAKTIVSKASVIIPALLEFAHSSQEDIDDALAQEDANAQHAPVQQQRRRTAAVDEEFDWESGESDDEDEGVAHAGADEDEDDDHLTRIQRDAKSWDAFLSLVYALRPFDDDSQEYRKARAVQTFNAAADMMKEYKRLHPSAVSACPHVALCVLPRQQVSV